MNDTPVPAIWERTRSHEPDDVLDDVVFVAERYGYAQRTGEHLGMASAGWIREVRRAARLYAIAELRDVVGKGRGSAQRIARDRIAELESMLDTDGPGKIGRPDGEA